MHGDQAGLAQCGLLEREGERGGAAGRVTDAYADLAVSCCRLLTDYHHRAGRMRGDVLANRAEDHRGERTDAAGAHDQHRRARSRLGERVRWRPGQLIDVDRQVGGSCGSAFQPRRPGLGLGSFGMCRTRCRGLTRPGARSSVAAVPRRTRSSAAGREARPPGRPSPPRAAILPSRRVPATTGFAAMVNLHAESGLAG